METFAVKLNEKGTNLAPKNTYNLLITYLRGRQGSEALSTKQGNTELQ